MNWFEKHSDTMAILGAFAAAIILMGYVHEDKEPDIRYEKCRTMPSIPMIPKVKI